jgi:hypothetical protein
MEAASSSAMSANIYQTTRHHIAEDFFKMIIITAMLNSHLAVMLLMAGVVQIVRADYHLSHHIQGRSWTPTDPPTYSVPKFRSAGKIVMQIFDYHADSRRHGAPFLILSYRFMAWSLGTGKILPLSLNTITVGICFFLYSFSTVRTESCV